MSTKVSKLYAQVVVDLLEQEKGSEESLSRALKDFQDLLAASSTLQKVLTNPTLSTEQRSKACDAALSGLKIEGLSARFLKLLAVKNRIGTLAEITKDIEALLLTKKGGVVGELVGATAMSAEAIATIEAALGKKMNCPVKLSARIDSSLIAGLRVTVQGKTFDGSAKAKFEKFLNH